MGGRGPDPGYRWDKRSTVEDSRSLDVRRLHRGGCLHLGSLFNWQWSIAGEPVGNISIRVEANCIILLYRYRGHHDEEWQKVEERVPLTWTPCNFGGKRPWFLCPGCNRRVALLYDRGKYFLCRHCYGLCHASRNESQLDRLLRKARKIRRRLHASMNLSEPITTRPKGMHRSTFYRLISEVRRVESKISFLLAKRFGIPL